jgi:hypothetical protein
VRKGKLSVLVALLVGIPALWPFISYAEEPPPGSALKYSVHGKQLGNQLMLTVRLGDVETEAISIYSEPSHTLLVAFIDSDFSVTKDGQFWEEDNVQRYDAGAIVRAIPRKEETILHVPARPKADNQIDVWFAIADHTGHVDNELQSHGTYGSSFLDSNYIKHQVAAK